MKTLKTIEDINKEFDKKWNKGSLSLYGQPRKGLIKSFYASKIEELLEKQAKAFGGCLKCYGKGFSTEKTSITAYADFSGTDKKIELMRYNPCSCDRGKQFRQVIEELVKSLVPEKESGKAHTPSIHENAEVEGLYDVICSEIGFERSTKKLRDLIRLFGKKRFNQAVQQIQENINKIRGEKMSSSIKPRCGICGGVKTFIRGRTPQNKKRWVCPTCLAERMDYIHDISSEYYDSDCKSPELTQERQERK